MANLLFYRGEEKLLEYRLQSNRTSIGRADTCDVALPGDAISRTHCFVVQRDGACEVIDRSRHGIVVDGKPTKRAPLTDGSEIGLGGFRIVYRATVDVAGPTAETVSDRGHEVVMDAGADRLVVERACLVVFKGPDEGSRKVLKKSRMSLGRRESDLRFADASIVEEHCHVRVSRGRVMVEPGRGAAYIDGERVRAITPLYADETLAVGNNVLRVERSQDEEVPFAKTFGEMVGESKRMLTAFGILRRMAAHHYPVLITGESGTGKELAARGIHDHGMRAAAPFVAINCGAIAPTLFESELFGHEKGAFTDASARKHGAFHEADGGTLFLDEVGELPEAAQAKLLRALESGEVRRVGSTTAEYPDVRVLAATNRDLTEAVRSGRFREDLFFRLHVLSVELPPLRDRTEDLRLLSEIVCRSLHPEAHVTDDAVEVLCRHSWPGNVRELRNVLTRAYVMRGPRIGPSALQFHSVGTAAAASGRPIAAGTLRDAERAYIQRILEKHQNNRSAAARELGLARSTLHYKMNKLGIR
ncbi:MAG: sigma 54-interacting transcriptional regulator [Myxococcota bacterium]|nr:sigma 54-interacting transcriptional regulator [Myxococcota bacterium]